MCAFKSNKIKYFVIDYIGVYAGYVSFYLNLGVSYFILFKFSWTRDYQWSKQLQQMSSQRCVHVFKSSKIKLF